MITEDTGITEADTPETNRNIVEIGFDVHGNPCRFVPVEFARRLECERDEARKALDEAHKYFKWIYLVADSQRKWNFRTLATEGLMKTGGAK